MAATDGLPSLVDIGPLEGIKTDKRQSYLVLPPYKRILVCLSFSQSVFGLSCSMTPLRDQLYCLGINPSVWAIAGLGTCKAGFI